MSELPRAPKRADANDELRRLRRTLAAAAVVMFVATFIELGLQSHTEGLQLLGVVACVLGAATAGLVALATPRRTLHAIAGSGLAVVAALSGLGLWEHFEHNFGFVREIRPEMPLAAAVLEALGGASPPLAPGMLIVAAVLAWAGRRRVGDRPPTSKLAKRRAVVNTPPR